MMNEELISINDSKTNNKLESFKQAQKVGLLPKGTSIEAAYVIAEVAERLGLDPINTVLTKGLYVINGVVSLNSKSKNALAHAGGCSLEVLRYYEPVFITDNPRNMYLEGTIQLNEEGNPKTLIIEKTSIMVTTLKMTRNGKSCIMNYSTLDAARAGHLTKETWKNYPAEMFFNRCVSRLCDTFAPDLTLGLKPSTNSVEK